MGDHQVTAGLHAVLVDSSGSLTESLNDVVKPCVQAELVLTRETESVLRPQFLVGDHAVSFVVWSLRGTDVRVLVEALVKDDAHLDFLRLSEIEPVVLDLGEVPAELKSHKDNSISSSVAVRLSFPLDPLLEDLSEIVLVEGLEAIVVNGSWSLRNVSLVELFLLIAILIVVIIPCVLVIRHRALDLLQRGRIHAKLVSHLRLYLLFYYSISC